MTSAQKRSWREIHIKFTSFTSLEMEGLSSWAAVRCSVLAPGWISCFLSGCSPVRIWLSLLRVLLLIVVVLGSSPTKKSEEMGSRGRFRKMICSDCNSDNFISPGSLLKKTTFLENRKIHNGMVADGHKARPIKLDYETTLSQLA